MRTIRARGVRAASKESIRASRCAARSPSPPTGCATGAQIVGPSNLPSTQWAGGEQAAIEPI
jgi:hypothetical protein